MEQHSINGKATTIYISDFLSEWVEADLWRFLQGYGMLVDIYIAAKRSKANSRFGFARLIKVDSVQEPVSCLNGAHCGYTKLKANLAKYERKKVISRVGYYGNRFVEPNRVEEYGNTRRRSYVEEPLSNPATKEIRFTTSDISRRVARATLIGESESFEKLMNVKAFKEVEGNPSVDLRYVGGLNTLLEFEDEEIMTSFLRNGEHVWKHWFKTLTPWRQDMQLNKRVSSLLVYGVSLHAWCEEAFSNIAKIWGTVLILETCDTSNQNLA
ncbi:hypothetical protein L1887_14081 [Cichorium endivia]|nr:hypothetical protein L1887_14081 [Cichorium endivia]